MPKNDDAPATDEAAQSEAPAEAEVKNDDAPATDEAASVVIEPKTVRAKEDFTFARDHEVVDAKEGQEFVGELGGYLFATGAPVEEV